MPLGRHGWLIVLVLGALLVFVYFGFNIPSAAQLIINDAMRLAPGLVVLIMARRLDPTRTTAWRMFGAGAVLFGVGDTCWDLLEAAGLQPYPSVADICYLAAYALVVVGLLALMRIGGGGDVSALLDAAIAAAGCALVLWFVVRIAPPTSTIPLAGRLLSSAYLVMDFFLLVVATRLAMAADRRTPTHYLILIGIVSLIVSDLGFAAADAGGSYSVGQPTDLGWLVAAVVWTAAALHPSMQEFGRQSRGSRGRGLPGPAVALLVVVSLLGPTVIAAKDGDRSVGAGVLARLCCFWSGPACSTWCDATPGTATSIRSAPCGMPERRSGDESPVRCTTSSPTGSGP